MKLIPNDSLQTAFEASIAIAARNKHEFVTSDHLVLAMLSSPELKSMLPKLGIDIDLMEVSLTASINKEQDPTEVQHQPSYAKRIHEILNVAAHYASATSKDGLEAKITPQLVLLSVMDYKDTATAIYLNKYGVTPLKIKSFLSHGQNPEGKLTGLAKQLRNEQDEQPEIPPLEKYAVNLNDRARSGRIEKLIGRTKEVERTAMILSRHRKNNPLLVGEPGVGKTAIAEGLAKMIEDGHAPDAIKDKKIWSLSMGTLVAGTKFRGDFEQRVKDVMDQVAKDPDIILFIDEIHTMIGAGASGSGGMDASNILKPALANGDLRVIGATTFQEYRDVFEKEKALDRRFQKIDIVEPSPEETVQILKGVRQSLERHHNIKYSTESIKKAVEFSVKHMPDRFLPDKAIDVLDEAGAAERMKPESSRKPIDGNAIAETIARMARIPVSKITDSEKTVVKGLSETLKSKVFGQDEAIDTFSSAVCVAKAGLNSDRKPLLSMMFAGPTGVGKTEVARLAAQHMGVPLIRFDMSEFKESHSVAKMIGSPSGYVGHEKGGLLTEAVFKNPYCILLLDEIEKAHPDVYDLFLQVMDNGFLMDSNGRSVSFKNCMVLMTTNAGAQVVQKNTIGFTSPDRTSEGTAVLNATFAPEFRNRLDAVINFKPLGTNEVRMIVDKNISILNDMLSSKSVSISLSDAAKDLLAKEGHDPRMGARPMERLINSKLKTILAEKMLFGELQNGGLVYLDVDGSELSWEIQPHQKPAPKTRKTKMPAM